MSADRILSTPSALVVESRRRVLIVDDDAMVGECIQRALARKHDVVCFTDGRDAIERIESGELVPDVVFCDLMMPLMTGMAFHAQLQRSRPALAERIIFLSGGAFTPAARAFLDCTTNRCIEKPFSIANIRSVVADTSLNHT